MTSTKTFLYRSTLLCVFSSVPSLASDASNPLKKSVATAIVVASVVQGSRQVDKTETTVTNKTRPTLALDGNGTDNDSPFVQQSVDFIQQGNKSGILVRLRLQDGKPCHNTGGDDPKDGTDAPTKEDHNSLQVPADSAADQHTALGSIATNAKDTKPKQHVKPLAKPIQDDAASVDKDMDFDDVKKDELCDLPKTKLGQTKNSCLGVELSVVFALRPNSTQSYITLCLVDTTWCGTKNKLSLGIEDALGTNLYEVRTSVDMPYLGGQRTKKFSLMTSYEMFMKAQKGYVKHECTCTKKTGFSKKALKTYYADLV